MEKQTKATLANVLNKLAPELEEKARQKQEERLAKQKLKKESKELRKIYEGIAAIIRKSCKKVEKKKPRIIIGNWTLRISNSGSKVYVIKLPYSQINNFNGYYLNVNRYWSVGHDYGTVRHSSSYQLMERASQEEVILEVLSHLE